MEDSGNSNASRPKGPTTKTLNAVRCPTCKVVRTDVVANLDQKRPLGSVDCFCGHVIRVWA